MKYLEIIKDKNLINKEKGKYREIYKNQLFTLKEFEALRKIFYTLSIEDVRIVEISKKNVVDYWGDGIKTATWNVELPF